MYKITPSSSRRLSSGLFSPGLGLGAVALACAGATTAQGAGSTPASGDRMYVQKPVSWLTKKSRAMSSSSSARWSKDHTRANDGLKQIASGKSIDVPAATDAEHQKAKAKMQAMSAEQFDRALKVQMVADHKKTIALVQHASKLGRMPT